MNEAVRALVERRINELETDFQAVSKALDLNPSYIQQFVRYGKPKKLPEDVRKALAEHLDLDETALGAPPARRERQVAERRQGDLFMLNQVDINGHGGPGGGVDTTEWVTLAGGGATIYAHQRAGTWGLPSAFARQELNLHSGFADVLTVYGPSMDDGTAYSLKSGDRVIIDRLDQDARQGGIFAVWDGGGVIIKQVEIVRGTDPVQLLCKSLNPRFDPIRLFMDGNAHIIGRVAARITRM